MTTQGAAQRSLRGAAWAIALVALLAAAAPASAQFSNAQATAFGRIDMAPYASGRGPVDLEAVVHFDAAAVPQGGRLLVGFNAQGDGVHARLDRVETLSGRELPTEGATGVARRAVAAAALAGLAEPIVLRGSAWADGNGRFHVGALAIAFDAGWQEATAGGQPASLYAFTVLGQEGLPGPPVTGMGNDALAAVPLGLLGITASLMAWRALRPAPLRPLSLRPVPMAVAAPPAARTAPWKAPTKPAPPPHAAALAPWTPSLPTRAPTGPRVLHVAPAMTPERLAAIDRAQGRGRPRAPPTTWPPPRATVSRGAHPVRSPARAPSRPPGRQAPFPHPVPRPRPPAGPQEPGEAPPRPRGPVPQLSRPPAARPSPAHPLRRGTAP